MGECIYPQICIVLRKESMLTHGDVTKNFLIDRFVVTRINQWLKNQTLGNRIKLF